MIPSLPLVPGTWLTRGELGARGCTTSLIEVIEQVPARAAVRLPMVLDPSSVGLLLLWTILRWERTGVLIGLEGLGVDMWALTRELDALVAAQKSSTIAATLGVAVPSTASSDFGHNLAVALESWVQQAQTQARLCGRSSVGPEHVLLAMATRPEAKLAELLERHNLRYDRLAAAIAEGRMADPVEAEVVKIVPPGPFGAAWDKPATGVPRRFSLGVVMLMTTLYAVLFAVMRLLGAHPAVFGTIAILFAGVAVGQMVLYGGRYPRAASIWVGAGLFTAEILGLTILYGGHLEELACLLCISPVIGAFLGYLAGGLTGGVFLLLQMHADRAKARQAVEEQEVDVLAPTPAHPDTEPAPTEGASS